MKKLYESLLDNEDTLLDRTDIPNRPKVLHEDFFTYEQAWYDILDDMDAENIVEESDLKAYLDLYIKWHSKFKFVCPKANLNKDFIKMSAKQIIANYLSCVKSINTHDLNELKKDINKESRLLLRRPARIVEYLWRGSRYYTKKGTNEHEYLFDLFLRNRCFQKEPKYKMYYDAIRKNLNMKYNLNIE